ncbi:MAG: hypothetical protein ACTSUE_07080 [Promethearchaeota archaeon]
MKTNKKMGKKMNVKKKHVISLAFILCAISCISYAFSNYNGTTRLQAPGGSLSTSTITPKAYDFDVLNETVNVFVNYNGLLTVEYYLTIEPNAGSSAIDYIDLGFPYAGLDRPGAIATMTIGATTYNILNDDIEAPDKNYIQYGTTIHLVGSNRIDFGETGTLHFIGNVSGALYTDSQNRSMASFKFAPTWFDPNYGGYTIHNYNLTFYFPANENEGSLLKYHQIDDPDWKVPAVGFRNGTFFSGWPLQQRLYYNWDYASIDQEKHVFGASLPKSWLASGVVKVNPAIANAIYWGLTIFGIVTVLVSSIYLSAKYKQKMRTHYYPPVQKKKNPLSGVLCCGFWIAVMVIFFNIDQLEIIIFAFSIGSIVAGFAFIAYFLARSIDKRRKEYIKPKMSIECVGVNKNLTVPEAAIIKNTPLGKVIFLIIFGLMKKQLISVEGIDPIRFKKSQKLYTDNLRKMDEKGRKIRDYEIDFYEAIDDKTGIIKEAKLKSLLIKMIKKVYKKMVGFELKATVVYHDGLMVKAWAQVRRSKGDVDLDAIEKEFEYMMLDDDFEGKSKAVFSNRRIFVPYWYNSYYWWRHPGMIVGTPRSGVGGRISGATFNMGAFSNSIASGIQNITNNIATNVSTFFNGIINAVSPKPPKSTGGSYSSSGRSYGGSSCACACACACAGCACACAGGGR